MGQFQSVALARNGSCHHMSQPQTVTLPGVASPGTAQYAHHAVVVFGGIQADGVPSSGVYTLQLDKRFDTAAPPFSNAGSMPRALGQPLISMLRPEPGDGGAEKVPGRPPAP